MKKRILSFCMLCCLFGPPATFYTYWWIQKKAVQKAVEAQFIRGLPQDALTLVRVAVKDAPHLLEWEGAGEFVYNAQMYDVVKCSQQGDSLHYWCWWDHQETELQQQLQALIAESVEQHQPCRDNKAQLLIFFKSLFYAAPPNLNWPLEDILPEPQSRVFSDLSLHARKRAAPPGPPPEC